MDWKRTTCKISQANIESNKKNPARYRVTANVTEVDKISIQNPVLAYYGPDNSFNFDNIKDAQQAHRSITSRLVIPCSYYIPSMSGEIQISVKVVSPDIPIFVLWISIVVASSSGLFFCVSFCATANDRVSGSDDTFSSILTYRYNPTHPARTSELTRSTKRRHLTARQAKFVCTTFSRESSYKKNGVADHSTQMCSICLEEIESGGDTTSGVSLVMLPCMHEFHKSCICRWLCNGKSLCPLCQWDVTELFDEKGEPKNESAFLVCSNTSKLQNTGAQMSITMCQP